ncbi:dephospho-CoA kinase [bacterium]|nr:dephospho-CoA kinase [bacterium]
MLKIAIVGNIASGKSTVENFIKAKGYKVYDTDKIAHKILTLNKNVIDEFGTNERAKLAKIVFSEPEKLKKLEEIIHPLVKKEILSIFENNFNIVFISVPQLFEAGFESLFDKIIYVTAEKNIRKNRLIKRNNYTEEEALKRIEAQNEDNKKEKADFVIENNSTILELENSIDYILKEILS